MKYSQLIGIIAALCLIASCFLPWMELPEQNLILNGLNGKVNNDLSFGKQIIPHSLFALISIICFLIKKIGAKRTNIFVACFNLGWAIKNYILFSMCRQGDCPQVKIGLVLMIIFSGIIMVMALLPKMEVKK